MDTLKQEAKRIYFANVKAERFRISFLESLEILPVVDHRSKGFYCSQCKEFSEKKQMQFYKESAIYRFDHCSSLGKKIAIWLVNPHYDGCRGWD